MPTKPTKIEIGESRSRDSEISEQSPLLPPSDPTQNGSSSQIKTMSALGERNDVEAEEDTWMGEEEESRSSWYMFLLTFGGFGLQMGWSVEMSNGSPYLLSLGLNKSLLALVWIAGPLSGVLVQPYVGIKSDRLRSRWGKRRPFIIGGGLATIASLMVLAWTREIVTWIFGLFGAAPDSQAVTVTIQLFAVIFIYVLDFAINVIQAALRAFAVDNAPTHQQETANAWISRISGVGNIVGMFFGGINLPKTLPWLGNSQFKVLCAIASISMLVTAGTTCATVGERDSRHDEDKNSNEGVFALFKSLWKSLFRLPPQVAQVCWVQFLAWMGWFPFLFYTSTYVGEIFADPYFEANPNMSKEEVDELWERGTRRGTVALLAFAIVTFVASVILPFLVAPTYKSPLATSVVPVGPNAQPELMTATPASSVHRLGRSSGKRSAPIRWARKFRDISSTVLSNLHIPGLTLRRTWIYSHFLFFICMWLTLIVRDVTLATVLVGLVGIPWAITMWAPFALISAEVSKREAIRRRGLRIPNTGAIEDDITVQAGADMLLGDEETTDQAGVVLGIHNCAISAPQVIMTVAGSLLFKWLQKPRGTPGDESVAWFFRLGGLCALAAAFLTLRIPEEGDTAGSGYSRIAGRTNDEEGALGDRE